MQPLLAVESVCNMCESGLCGVWCAGESRQSSAAYESCHTLVGRSLHRYFECAALIYHRTVRAAVPLYCQLLRLCDQPLSFTSSIRSETVRHIRAGGVNSNTTCTCTTVCVCIRNVCDNTNSSNHALVLLRVYADYGTVRRCMVQGRLPSFTQRLSFVPLQSGAGWIAEESLWHATPHSLMTERSDQRRQRAEHQTS